MKQPNNPSRQTHAKNCKKFALSRFFIFLSIPLLAAWIWRIEINTIIKGLRSDYHLAQASLLVEKNLVDDALEQLELSTQLNPSNKPAWELVASLTENRDPQAHLQALSELAALSAPDPAPALRFLRLARTTGQLPLATPFIPTLLNKFPNNPRINHESALILTSLSLITPARELLKTANSLEPENQEIRLALYTVELLSSDPQTSQAAATRIENMNFTDPLLAQTATYNLITYYKNTDPAKAAALITKALETDPASWDLRLLQIDLAYRNADEALPDLFSKALQQAKNPTQISSLLSRIAEYENPEAALLMLSAMPTNNIPPAERALMEMPIHWAAENYEKILTLADSAPTNATPATLSKISLWKLRALAASQPFKISAHLDNILKNFSQRPKILLEMSATLRNWRMPYQARPILQRLADSRGPYAFHALMQLFDIALADDDTPTLFTITKSMLELQPDNAVLQFNYAALSLEIGINLPQAESLAASLYKKHPNEPAIAHLYAQALAANGKKKEALAIYDALPPDKLAASPILNPYETLLISTLDSGQQPFERSHASD